MKPEPNEALLARAASVPTEVSSARLGYRRWLRFALVAAVGLFYFGAVMDAADPVVALVGLAPLVWLAVEAVWRLFDR